MSIKAYTLNITYEGTTRPITFVENENDILSKGQIVALTLYTFKDLIPDYQLYSMMNPSFNIRNDKEAQLILPPLDFKFSVETLGHGTLDIVIGNPHCFSSCYVPDIKVEIQKQIGIPTECIQLCDSEGIEVSHHICYNINTLFAIFNDYKDQVLEQGYDIIEYKSVFKEGRLMRVSIVKRIGNYLIVRFLADIHRVVKRTPKMIFLDTKRRKIRTDFCLGECLGYLVAWDERIRYGKLYAIAC